VSAAGWRNEQPPEWWRALRGAWPGLIATCQDRHRRRSWLDGHDGGRGEHGSCEDVEGVFAVCPAGWADGDQGGPASQLTPAAAVVGETDDPADRPGGGAAVDEPDGELAGGAGRQARGGRQSSG